MGEAVGRPGRSGVGLVPVDAVPLASLVSLFHSDKSEEREATTERETAVHTILSKCLINLFKLLLKMPLKTFCWPLLRSTGSCTLAPTHTSSQFFTRDITGLDTHSTPHPSPTLPSPQTASVSFRRGFSHYGTPQREQHETRPSLSASLKRTLCASKLFTQVDFNLPRANIIFQQ